MRRTVQATALLLLALSTAPAISQEQKINLLQKYDDWAAYTEVSGGTKACFVVSQPKDSSPEIAGRGPVYFYVSFYPDEKITREVSVRMGYAPDGKVTATIGNDTFELLTKDEAGFVDKIVDADKLIADMKAGIAMRIQGRSASGATQDSFSLSGVTDAFERANKECNG